MESEQHEGQSPPVRPWTLRLLVREEPWRFVPPRFRDVRWVIGAILLLAGFLGSLRVIAGFDHSAPVWSVRRTVLPGERLTTADLVRTRAHVAGREPTAYAGPDLPRPEQRVVQHVVAAGELLPLSALGPASDLDTRSVDVPLAGPAHPPEPGSYAEMWLAKRSGDEHAPTYDKPGRLLDRVLVGRAASRGSHAAEGAVVTVRVPQSAVPTVIDAINTRASITLVPILPAGHP